MGPWWTGLAMGALGMGLGGLAFAQQPDGTNPRAALAQAVNEMVEELKAIGPARLGALTILPLEEPTEGATEAGDFVRRELERALQRANFNLVARDRKAQSKVLLELCRSVDGHTTEETAKSFGNQIAADSMVLGHLDRFSREWRISIRVVQTNSTVIPLVTQRFVPLESIPKRYQGRRLPAVLDDCVEPETRIEQDPSRAKTPLRVAVMPWGGFAGGLWFNGGLKPTTASKYRTEYALDVHFIPVESIEASVELWKKKAVDVLWITIDDLPTEHARLAIHERPRLIMQAAWSRGEEALVARTRVNDLNALEGKSVVLLPRSPAHSFLLISLDLAGLPPNAARIIEADTYGEAASLFIRGKGDAAVVWAPDDVRVVKALGDDAQILETTQDADFLVAESLVARESVVEKDGSRVQKLVNGWLRANAILNNPRRARERREAVKILENSFFQLDHRKAQDELRKVRLTTLGDNLNFFGLNEEYQGERGSNLHDYFWRAYREAGQAKGAQPKWTNLVDLSFLRRAKKVLRGPEHAAEPPPIYRCRAEQPVLSDRELDVNFTSGAHGLSNFEKQKIDREFGHLARIFLHDCILIVGHTDDVGDAKKNLELSWKRANAVRKHLVDDYGFDPARFVLEGRGEADMLPRKPGERLADWRRRNRRTEFELLRDLPAQSNEAH